MTSPVTPRTTEVADLQHKIDEADNDIVLINKRLDEAQGMFLGQSYLCTCLQYKHDAENCVIRCTYLQMVLRQSRSFELS